MERNIPCITKNLDAGYGGVAYIRNVNIQVGKNEKVAIIGPNGAGKTTIMNTLVGILKPLRGEVQIFGNDIRYLEPHKIVELGISIVPEGGRVFPRLTVLENILASISRNRKTSITLEELFRLFPILKDRKDQLAGTLSGGEQRMLAIARAIARSPKFLIVDELSLGLAPKIISAIYASLNVLWETANISMLITEQYIKRALEFSHRAYLVENGSIVLEGPSVELLDNPNIKETYLKIHE
jgi:branched-chain amino acid transport system ATP-binding protein